MVIQAQFPPSEPRVPSTNSELCKQMNNTSLAGPTYRTDWVLSIKCGVVFFSVYVCAFLSLDIVWKQKMRLG